MVDLFDIGVRLSLTSNVAPGLRTMARDLVGIRSELGKTQRELDRFTAAMAGSGKLTTGAPSLGALLAPARAGGEAADRQSLMLADRLKLKDAAHRTALSYRAAIDAIRVASAVRAAPASGAAASAAVANRTIPDSDIRSSLRTAAVSGGWGRSEGITARRVSGLGALDRGATAAGGGVLKGKERIARSREMISWEPGISRIPSSKIATAPMPGTSKVAQAADAHSAFGIGPYGAGSARVEQFGSRGFRAVDPMAPVGALRAASRYEPRGFGMKPGKPEQYVPRKHDDHRPALGSAKRHVTFAKPAFEQVGDFVGLRAARSSAGDTAKLTQSVGAIRTAMRSDLAAFAKRAGRAEFAVNADGKMLRRESASRLERVRDRPWAAASGARDSLARSMGDMSGRAAKLTVPAMRDALGGLSARVDRTRDAAEALRLALPQLAAAARGVRPAKAASTASMSPGRGAGLSGLIAGPRAVGGAVGERVKRVADVGRSLPRAAAGKPTMPRGVTRGADTREAFGKIAVGPETGTPRALPPLAGRRLPPPAAASNPPITVVSNINVHVEAPVVSADEIRRLADEIARQNAATVGDAVIQKLRERSRDARRSWMIDWGNSDVYPTAPGFGL